MATEKNIIKDAIVLFLATNEVIATAKIESHEIEHCNYNYDVYSVSREMRHTVKKESRWKKRKTRRRTRRRRPVTSSVNREEAAFEKKQRAVGEN